MIKHTAATAVFCLLFTAPGIARDFVPIDGLNAYEIMKGCEAEWSVSDKAYLYTGEVKARMQAARWMIMDPENRRSVLTTNAFQFTGFTFRGDAREYWAGLSFGFGASRVDTIPAPLMFAQIGVPGGGTNIVTATRIQAEQTIKQSKATRAALVKIEEKSMAWPERWLANGLRPWRTAGVWGGVGTLAALVAENQGGGSGPPAGPGPITAAEALHADALKDTNTVKGNGNTFKDVAQLRNFNVTGDNNTFDFEQGSF